MADIRALRVYEAVLAAAGSNVKIEPSKVFPSLAEIPTGMDDDDDLDDLGNLNQIKMQFQVAQGPLLT